MIFGLLSRFLARVHNRVMFKYTLWQIEKGRKLVEEGKDIERQIDAEISFLNVSSHSLDLAESAGFKTDRKVTPEMVEARLNKLYQFKNQLAKSQDNCLRDLNEKLQLLSDLTKEAAEAEASR